MGAVRLAHKRFSALEAVPPTLPSPRKAGGRVGRENSGFTSNGSRTPSREIVFDLSA